MPLNATRAYHAFERHASITGNATSLAMVGFFHGTGYGNLLPGTQVDDIIEDTTVSLPADQGRALAYYTFAAQLGDYGSQMALGYRYWTGIGVNEDCMVALDWYEAAAEQGLTSHTVFRLVNLMDDKLWPIFIPGLPVDAHFR